MHNDYNEYNNYNEYNGNYTNNNKNKKDGIGSWIFIALLIAGGAWFIGIPLLLIKLFSSDNPKSERRQAPPLYRESYYSHRTSDSTYYNNTVRSNSSREYVPSSIGSMSETAKDAARSERAKKSFREFSKSPKDVKKAAILLIVIGAFLAMLGITMGAKAFEYSFDLPGFVFSMGWLASGITMVASGIGMKKAEVRYARYIAVIGSNPAVNISALAKKLGIKEKTVHKDLQKMIDKGYFGASAYLNEELGYLFTSSDADDELRKVKDAAMEKVKEAKAKQTVEDAAKASSEYQSILAQIRDINDRIKHPVMSEKIYNIENITREIFRTVEDNPDKKNKIDKFLNYYLPTTLKLLESYAKLEKTGSEGDNIGQSMKSIEAAMDSIVQGFEHQLDDLYKSDVMDIETDIDVMTKMMNRDNNGKDEFHVSDYENKVDTRSQFEKDFNVQKTSDGTISYGGSAAQTK